MSSFLSTKNRKEIASLSAITVTSIVAIVAWKYQASSKKIDEQKSTPVLKGVPILGTLPSTIANLDRFYDYITEVYENLNTLTFRTEELLFTDVVSTIDPKNIEYVLKDNFEGYIKGRDFDKAMHDLLGNGIFNTDGENWKFQRKTASRIFYIRNFRDNFTNVFVNEINILSKEIFDKAITTGESIDLHDMMLRFTMDSFTELAFGVKLNSITNKVDFVDSFDTLQLHAFKRSAIPYYHETEVLKEHLFYYFRPKNKKTIKQHLDIVNQFAEEMIKKHKNITKDENLEKNDLLSLFIRATNLQAKQLNDTELRDTVLNFIIAGRDTTAQALSWTFYVLMKYPEIQEKVYQEAIQFVTDDIENDPPKLYELIQEKIIYTHAVLNEVLRIYPSVPGNRKEALRDDVWPDGTQIKKGDVISWQSYCQGRSETIWGPNAKQFIPERWISDADGSLIRAPPSKWSVFHAGPRICLGQNLAILEALVAILIIVKRYKFHHVADHNVVILNLVTLSMRDGLKVTVEKRQ